MAQRAGFGIADIRELLAISAGHPLATRQWRELATSKLPEIEAHHQRPVGQLARESKCRTGPRWTHFLLH
jgi:DNA-binding transcriptional MerR regulator